MQFLKKADADRGLRLTHSRTLPGSTALGTVGLWMYFHQSKVTEVAKETGLPRHKDTKAAGRGSDAPTATGEAPLSRNQYHAESSSAPSGVASYLLPNLDKSDREDLDNLTVGSDSGRFGRTIKQAARYDQRKKDRDFEEKLKQYQDAASGKAEGEEGDPPARSKDHLRDLQAHKRTT